MMKTYQMMGVDQSAARYVETKGNRRHTCEQLRISYWCAVALLCVASAVVFSDATVYLYSL